MASPCRSPGGVCHLVTAVFLLATVLFADSIAAKKSTRLPRSVGLYLQPPATNPVPFAYPNFLAHSRYAGLGLSFDPTTGAPNWTFPADVDWRAYTGPVDNQDKPRKCGLGWAFAAAAAIRAARAIAVGDPAAAVSPSPQQFLDCTSARDACGAGYPSDALQHAADPGHLLDRATYKYTAANGSCRANPKVGSITTAGFEAAQPLGVIGLILALQRQPVVVNLRGSARSFQLYRKGIYADTSCYSQRRSPWLDHTVLLVGYHYEGLTSRRNYFILRNSWGPGWGEKGHMRIKMSFRFGGICGMTSQPGLYPVLDVPKQQCAGGLCGTFMCPPPAPAPIGQRRSRRFLAEEAEASALSLGALDSWVDALVRPEGTHAAASVSGQSGQGRGKHTVLAARQNRAEAREDDASAQGSGSTMQRELPGSASSIGVTVLHGSGTLASLADISMRRRQASLQEEGAHYGHGVHGRYRTGWTRAKSASADGRHTVLSKSALSTARRQQGRSLSEVAPVAGTNPRGALEPQLQDFAGVPSVPPTAARPSGRGHWEPAVAVVGVFNPVLAASGGSTPPRTAGASPPGPLDNGGMFGGSGPSTESWTPEPALATGALLPVHYWQPFGSYDPPSLVSEPPHAAEPFNSYTPSGTVNTYPPGTAVEPPTPAGGAAPPSYIAEPVYSTMPLPGIGNTYPSGTAVEPPTPASGIVAPPTGAVPTTHSLPHSVEAPVPPSTSSRIPEPGVLPPLPTSLELAPSFAPLPSGAVPCDCSAAPYLLPALDARGMPSCVQRPRCFLGLYNPCGVGACVDGGGSTHTCICPAGFKLQHRPADAASPTPTGTATCVPRLDTESDPGTYTTQQGDTCSLIHTAFRMDQTTFLNQNPGLDCNKLTPGLVLNVQAPPTLPTCALWYTVSVADAALKACSTPLTRFHLTFPQLLALNPGLDCSTLIPGQQVCVSTPGTTHGKPDDDKARLCTKAVSILPGRTRAPTCRDIAKAYRLSWKTLYRLNPGILCDSFTGVGPFLGQQVCVKGFSASKQATCPKGSVPYLVRTEDSCTSLLVYHFRSPALLATLNHGWLCSNRRLYEGMPLCIPAS